MSQRLRVGLTIAGIVLGLIVALVARTAVQPNAAVDALAPNVWTVISVPLGFALGLLFSAPRRWPQALGWSGGVYFFSLFVAARLELLIRGAEAAQSSAHQLYFTLAPWVQLVGALGVGWWLSKQPPVEVKERH